MVDECVQEVQKKREQANQVESEQPCEEEEYPFTKPKILTQNDTQLHPPLRTRLI